MFERFTNRARRVVVLAQEQARQLNHNYIGTEHLLLGLAKEDDGIAGRVLAAHGMPYEVVRQDVIDKVMIGKGDSPSGHIPFTPRAKKTLELSLREALALNHTYIGTEHLLLGLIREGEGVAAQVLSKHADLLTIRSAVLDLVPAGDPDDGKDKLSAVAGRVVDMVRERFGGGRAATEEERRVTATPAAEATVSEAARLAGSGPVGSHHLLLAALADPDSAAARVLADLGVDLDQAKEALRGANVTGTSDEPPEIAGRRQMVIQVTDELVTVVAADPAIVAAAKSALAAVNAHSAATPAAQTGTAEETATAEETPEAEETGTPEETTAAGEPAGETATSATATTIRGDHPAATSLAAVWLALNDSLAAIRRAAEPAHSDEPSQAA
jgi:ATP-dependent Clp protease ATP-binding subunit ClpA